MWENGFEERIAKFMKATKECMTDNPLKTKTRALSLTDLSVAFLVLGVGMSFSAFCFAIENISKYVFVRAQGKLSHSKDKSTLYY